MGRKVFKQRSLALALAAAIAFSLPALLQGCLNEQAPETEPEAPVSPPAEEVIESSGVVASTKRGLFTLRYDPDSTVNPITGMNSDNILLSSLLYESLFSLDGGLNAEPVLCESWDSEDNISYTFILKPEIAFSDGSSLTSNDVVYSITQASQRGRFVNRLGVIDKITAEDDLTVTIRLKSPNRRFIRLLDIPIIKAGSIDGRIPPGTGPYMFAGADILRLVRFNGHRDYEKLPVPSVVLIVCEDDEAAELFEGGLLSLIWDDPADSHDIRLNRVHEKRYYDTTALQFIGFNTRSAVLSESDVRRAIGCAIDREFIVDEIMQGHAHPAQFALSLPYDLYSDQWGREGSDPQIEMAGLLSRAGLEDYDDDSYLEYPDGAGGYARFSLDFIVNSENQYKLRTAHLIAGALRQTGINVSVRELPWDSFISALETRNFDMYYGEVVLSADFDLSALLLPGGSLNFGRTGSSEFKPLIDAFLGAESDAWEREAAYELCKAVLFEAPFLPILYKKYVVYTPMGAISGAAPSQSGVFRMINDWTIDATMLA